MNTIEQKNTLRKILNSTKNIDVYYGRYSGRGMHGHQCLGVTLSRGDADDLCDALNLLTISYNRDSMGHTSIVYFTYINDLIAYQSVFERDDQDEEEE